MNNINIDFDRLYNDLAKAYSNKKDYPNGIPYGKVSSDDKDIGVIHFGNFAWKLTHNYSWIFANGKPVISIFNDASTATGVCVELLRAIFGDNFINLSGYR